MMRKCQACDKTGKKSIDTKVNDYVKDKKGYWHTDCYRFHLTTRRSNKLTKELAEAEIAFLKNKMAKDQQDQQDKDDFFNYITFYYNISLTSWQFNKVAKVNDGTFSQGMKEGISYFDLLEMWRNRKFINKLEKIAYKKNLDPTKRFDYDLVVVVGEYDKYKRAKIRKSVGQTQIKDMLEKTKITRESLKNRIVEKEQEEVDIFDMLD